MRTLDAAAVGIVIAVAVQAPGSYQALTSAIVGIRSHCANGGDLSDIKDSERISAVVVGLVGVAGALACKSVVPLVAALVADMVMIGVYEYAMRTQHRYVYEREGSGSAGYGAADSY